jgi:cell division septum initiation protein DivIVA
MKNFLIKKLLKSQMKGVPEEEVDKILEIIEKNPELFQRISTEVQEEISSGKDQMTASMEVMTKYQNELKDLN